MRNKWIIYGILFLAAACGVALAQSFGPRSGPVTWTYTIDGGWPDAGFADGGLTDGGSYDAGLQLACCLAGGFGTWQGPYTCVTTWNDAGYDPGTGGYNDGGFSDGGCTDAGVISNGNWLDGGQYDAGIKYAQNPYYLLDGGPLDGGFYALPQNGYTWLPVRAAIYNVTVSSNPITFAGFTTAGAASVTLNGVTGAGALAVGTLCLQQGYPAPANSWSDAGCDTLDGGVGPYTWNIGPIYTPALQLVYVPGAGSDGGYLNGGFSLTNY